MTTTLADCLDPWDYLSDADVEVAWLVLEIAGRPNGSSRLHAEGMARVIGYTRPDISPRRVDAVAHRLVRWGCLGYGRITPTGFRALRDLRHAAAAISGRKT